MELKDWLYELKLAHTWTIASVLQPDGSGGGDLFRSVLVELRDEGGTVGLGEAAPSWRYLETVETTEAFIKRVDPAKLSFEDIPGSRQYLDQLALDHFSPKCALDIALWDGAGRKAGRPIYDLLGLGFREGKHVTSFSIGIDRPEVIREKAAEAKGYPVWKLKVGGPEDEANLAALREVCRDKPLRVDANEAWKTKEEALRRIEWLAGDGHVEFVEQPMPATMPAEDWKWLKERSPLPLMADESYLGANDAEFCAGCFHGVNVKLVKAGGISGARAALEAARRAGLKTMIGCMIESSVLISAAAHLAELADYLDLDGNLLITNDPYAGVATERGMLSFEGSKERTGLRVSPREE